MNDKESTIYKILSIVVEECTLTMNDVVTVTGDDILGKSKRGNVIMSRCIFVAQLKCMGYSDDTIAAVIGRKPKAIAEILSKAYEFKKTSKIFRITDAKCTIRINNEIPDA